ncbi:MAG: beta-1,6-N-acetylglucosaminyltransferase [Bacteroidales bacterium]|nr:beta-1,6-N-acetylglucosaminyltransferase [Bacteroidales bacterium]
MKHAYLIMAHTDFDMLQRLVSEIDDSRNDVYIHFDRKVPSVPSITAERSSLFVLQDRVDVRWGDSSVVDAEYALFESAFANGPYSYYHLLSGADLPLKSQDYIHKFFEDNAGRQFIGYTLTTITPEVVRKVMRWHLFPRSFRDAPLAKRFLRAAFIRFQEFFGIFRNRDIDFKKGSQWVSVTGEMVELFIANKSWARKTFTHTFCSDEMVMQTLCWNSPLRESIYNTEDDGIGCMRAISWENGAMKTWSGDDLERLRKTKYLFARKFVSHQ